MKKLFLFFLFIGISFSVQIEPRLQRIDSLTNYKFTGTLVANMNKKNKWMEVP
ncbi:hypothetical protein [Flavobacterium sp. J27]|uniref:hypothetical protein n=1 Tax=Flavobacterium sp. J27 TaxID=2060419 RepID=UPI0013EE613D|nr:hypothetical protein [Flavobacterium sp. J27]